MILYRLYYCLSFLLWPFLSLLLLWRIAKGKEDRARFREKKGITDKQKHNPENRLIWIHAASVGETLSMLVLIQNLLDMDDKLEILITSGTITSARLMQQRLPQTPRAYHQFAPLDNPVWVERFLDHWRPDIVLWAESELWPNILSFIKNRKIPLLLINGRMSPRSFKKWQYMRPFIKYILGLFQHIMVQSAEDAYHFELLADNTQTDITMTDNLKFAAAPLPFDKAELEKLSARLKNRPLIIFSSTHAGEETIALNVHKKLQKKNPKICSILIPRHPNRKDDIKAIFEKSGTEYIFRSDEIASAQTIKTKKIPDFYIADTLGELGLFYRLGEIIVMGGSFVPVGGHNPIEPAQLECAIITGPEIFNFQQTYADLFHHDAACMADDTEHLVEHLQKLLSKPDRVQRLAANALALTQQKNKQTIGLVLEKIHPYLQLSSGIK